MEEQKTMQGSRSQAAFICIALMLVGLKFQRRGCFSNIYTNEE